MQRTHEVKHHVGSVWHVVEKGTRKYISNHYSEIEALQAASAHNRQIELAEKKKLSDAGFVRSLPAPGQCACGATASWSPEHAVHGSDGSKVGIVWAGCPYCKGTAVGRPVNEISYDRLKPVAA